MAKGNEMTARWHQKRKKYSKNGRWIDVEEEYMDVERQKVRLCCSEVIRGLGAMYRGENQRKR